MAKQNFNSLFAEAATPTSQWEVVSEAHIEPSEVRQLREAAILTGQYGLYGQLRLKDGRLKSLPLAWETRQIVKAGDLLRLNSLRLIELTHQETGETKVFLAGIPM